MSDDNLQRQSEMNARSIERLEDKTDRGFDKLNDKFDKFIETFATKQELILAERRSDEKLDSAIKERKEDQNEIKEQIRKANTKNIWTSAIAVVTGIIAAISLYELFRSFL